MNVYDLVSPLDYRYYGRDSKLFQKLSLYVSEAAYIKYQLKVEAAIVKTLSIMGICPQKVADEVIKASQEITPEEVYEEEAKIEHNIRALVNCIRRRVSPEARTYVHLFATSNDILDTATALRLKELCRFVILPDLLELERTLIEMARAYANTVQIGRTHGQHAEPITFGYSLSFYVNRLGTRVELIDKTSKNLRGKFSGAVGAYNAHSIAYPKDPQLIEEAVLKELGLKSSDNHISTQIVEPEYVADLVYAIISCFSVLADLADDMRHLYRTEIAEVYERYQSEKVGSSTMPHKVNPKNFENIKSLWKAFMPRIITLFMDQLSEHQRDLTNSASGRFVTEIFTAFDYAVVRLNDALKKIEANVENMKKNVDLSKYLAVAEPIYIILALKGHPNAYDYTRKLIATSQETGHKLTEILWEDRDLKPYLDKLSDREKAILLNPALYIGAAFERTLAACDNWEKRCSLIEADG